MKTTNTNPWVVKTEKEIYSNPWISLSHKEVTTPKGTDGIYGVVHFKNHAVGVIPIDKQGNTWLVKQTRFVLDKPTWEIPEGGVPHHEAPLNGAKRELKEEVGLTAQKWDKLLEMELSNSITDEKATVYIATELSMGEQNLEDSEDITVHKMPVEQAIQMALEGEITDAISVAGLLKLALVRKDILSHL